jgi:methylenetetrahydrofolate reductase (NADPH)
VKEKTGLQERIESGRPILVVEAAPPKTGDPGPVRQLARRCAGKVHALGFSDNREGVAMSALAAAFLAASEGVEPVLHMTTRDRNRMALAADCLGAHAMGVRNVLCTTGTHQTLGPCRKARNVFDVDSVQLLQAISGLSSDGSLVGEAAFEGAGGFCLGATASPDADPVELQMVRLRKKIDAGARFVITEPVFDLERFEAWWSEVERHGFHENIAILAGILPLTDAGVAKVFAERRPEPRMPESALERIVTKGDPSAQRAAGIEAALETIERLSTHSGLRGFAIRLDGAEEAALEIIEKSGLGAE